MDGTTKQVLEHHDGYSIRHPASLTKMMTLYLVFDALQKKKITWDTTFLVSNFATKQIPCKLWLKKGEKVSVRTLAMALITRSANDAAVVVAEGLFGSQDAFVKKMNEKAKELGMKRTTFYNPSGVPDSRQITIAYDMALLGYALKNSFPAEFKLFNTQIFHYKGQAVRNHNHLLGIAGIHGIKTGYTVASGSNLTACATRNNRFLITVVLGAPSWHWRDQRVKELFNKHFSKPALAGKSMFSSPYDKELEDALDSKESLDDILPLSPMDEELEAIDEEVEAIIKPVFAEKPQVKRQALSPIKASVKQLTYHTQEGKKLPKGWTIGKPQDQDNAVKTPEVKKKK